jgi:choline dehydrogenase
LRVRIPEERELTPFQAAFVTGAVAAGVPRVDDLNDPDAVTGVAPSPANIYDDIRWNTALAYLDPVRERANLTVVGDALVDKVLLEGGRAVALEALIGVERVTIQAARIVLSAGAYGSPAILLRSGIGDAHDLRRLGAAALHELPGVGHGLTDHPIARIELRGSERLNQMMADFSERHWAPDEQTLLKARSRHCRDAFDLHLFAVSFRDPATGDWEYVIEVSNVAPLGAGRLSLSSLDTEAQPVIDHGYLSDVGGTDREVLLDGIELGREIVADMAGGGLVQAELAPGPERQSRADIARWVEDTVRIYYHPACSCRMGPAHDPRAVVDARGGVHGLEGLHICDASIFPTIMRANTNLPAVMLAEHMAGWIGDVR